MSYVEQMKAEADMRRALADTVKTPELKPLLLGLAESFDRRAAECARHDRRVAKRAEYERRRRKAKKRYGF